MIFGLVLVQWRKTYENIKDPAETFIKVLTRPKRLFIIKIALTLPNFLEHETSTYLFVSSLCLHKTH